MPATGKPQGSILAKKSPASRVAAALRNAFAVFGLVAAVGCIFLLARPAGRETAQAWLEAHHAPDAAPADAGTGASVASEPPPAQSAAPSGLDALPQEQAAVTRWLGKKYRVSPDALAALVQEAWRLGERHDIDPTLILAVMAVESGFNPFAQSAAGAQGLMQVMTRVHADKYEDFGGRSAAFDPLSNLHVGVRVLQECIARAGSVPGGLRHYVGAANLDSDGGYTAKVLAEHRRLHALAGRGTPFLTATAQDKRPA